MIKAIHKRRVFDNKQSSVTEILKLVYDLHEKIIYHKDCDIIFLCKSKDKYDCNEIKLTVKNIDYKYFLNLSTIILGDKINHLITAYDNGEVVLEINFKV